MDITVLKRRVTRAPRRAIFSLTGTAGAAGGASGAAGAEMVADPAELAVVQAEEVDMAVTDLRCRADAEPVLDAVRAERETEFLAGNRAELEVLRESYGG